MQQTLLVPSEIEQYCRRISGNDRDSAQAMIACIRQERSARDELAGVTIPADVSLYCRQMAESTGGSYQVMLACVQKELSD